MAHNLFLSIKHFYFDNLLINKLKFKEMLFAHVNHNKVMAIITCDSERKVLKYILFT